MRLTALLRGVLRSEGEFTTLGRELELIESYLDIERARFEQRLRVTIDVPPALRQHPRAAAGAAADRRERRQARHRAASGAAARSPSRRELDARRRRPRSSSLVVQDTGAGATADALERGRASRRRPAQRRAAAACQYGDGGVAVDSRRAPGAGTTVEIRLPVDRRASADAPTRSRWRRERPAPRRRRRRRAAGAVVPRRAAAIVRRRRGRRRSGVGQGSGRDDRAGEAGPGAARLADAGARRHRRRADAEEAARCRSSRSSPRTTSTRCARSR